MSGVNGVNGIYGLYGVGNPVRGPFICFSGRSRMVVFVGGALSSCGYASRKGSEEELFPGPPGDAAWRFRAGGGLRRSFEPREVAVLLVLVRVTPGGIGGGAGL